MNGNRRTVLGLALLGAFEPLLAASADAASHAALDRALAAIVTDPACELASLSVLAIRKHAIVYEGQFGRRRIGNGDVPDLPANRDTLYRIASVSKMVTTLGLMRLVEENKLDLDADVSRYLGFSLRNPHFPERAITLQHLLTHRSSLRDDAGYSFPAGTPLKDFVTPGARLYDKGAMWASNAGPGDYFTYCNLGWGLIGTLMERVTGERFDRLMQRLLLQPLGLTAGYNPAELAPGALDNLATLYRKRTTDTEVWDASGPWIAQVDDYRSKPPSLPPGIERYVIGENATPFSPTGGLRIAARDLGTLMLMLMNKGVHDGQRILQAATLERMFARQWTADGGRREWRHLARLVQRLGPGQRPVPGPAGPAPGGRRFRRGRPPGRCLWLALGVRRRPATGERDDRARRRHVERSRPGARPVFGAGALRGRHIDEHVPPRDRGVMRGFTQI